MSNAGNFCYFDIGHIVYFCVLGCNVVRGVPYLGAVGTAAIEGVYYLRYVPSSYRAGADNRSVWPLIYNFSKFF